MHINSLFPNTPAQLTLDVTCLFGPSIAIIRKGDDGEKKLGGEEIENNSGNSDRYGFHPSMVTIIHRASQWSTLSTLG